MPIPASAMRRVRLVVALTLFLTLLGFGRQAFAAADPPPPSFAITVDRSTVVPGEAAAVSVTFTNREATPVSFLFATVTASDTGPVGSTGLARDFSGCVGASWCDTWQTSYLRYNLTAPAVPVAPGDSRTVTLSFRYAPGVDCTLGAGVRFFVYYFYYEHGQGSYQGAEDSSPAAATRLVCPPAS
ncbi:hypothetical protein [Streptomyces sp. XY431]|uniref:hypothetical protein n=1 Tax=Streptomyces sp. XY431 TaxID=1415562 RepID=UPI00133191D8|nr:hypothetical protein [Streptomyces sp. XY431]